MSEGRFGAQKAREVVNVANLTRMIKKLQTAILNAGGMVKLATRQFYSEDQERMITVHSVSIPVWSERAQKMVDREQISTCSTAEVVKYLADMLEVRRNAAKP